MGLGLGLGLGLEVRVRGTKCRGLLIDTRIFELGKFVVELKELVSVALSIVIIKTEPLIVSVICSGHTPYHHSSILLYE